MKGIKVGVSAGGGCVADGSAVGESVGGAKGGKVSTGGTTITICVGGGCVAGAGVGGASVGAGVGVKVGTTTARRQAYQPLVGAGAWTTRGSLWALA